MKYFGIAMIISLSLLNSACMRAGLMALNAPGSGDTKIYEAEFDAQHGQKLDIYVPPHAANEKLDVIVFFYGGRWETGEKEDFRFVGNTFAQQNFIVVIPDYRKFPQVRFPEFVQDGAKSLAWVHDHIDGYGGNKTRIHVAGHSSGAHIGALLTADARYLKAEGKNRNDVIRDFAGLAGPYSFTPDEKDLKEIFAPPENYPQMQATTFITGREPPMLLLYGDKDTSVKRYNLDRLQQAIEQKHGCVKSIVYPDIGHIDIVVALSWLGKNKAPVRQDIGDFFRHSSCK